MSEFWDNDKWTCQDCGYQFDLGPYKFSKMSPLCPQCNAHDIAPGHVLEKTSFGWSLRKVDS